MKKTSLILLAIASILSISCKKQMTEKELVANIDFTLKVESPAITRTPIAATGNESKINNGMGFVFRGTDDNSLIDGAPFNLNLNGDLTSTKVTTEARAIFLVANATGVNFTGIRTLGELKAKTAELFAGETLTQNNANLIMWGQNTINKSNDKLYTSTVTLRFAPAKVTFMYTVNPTQEAQLLNQTVVVLNAHGETRLFPGGAFTPSKAEDHFAMMAPNADTYFSGDANFGNGTVKTALAEASTSSVAKTFYLFENSNEASSTIIAVRGEVNGTTYYYPIHFSSKDSGNAAFESILGGKMYNVSAKINDIAGGTTDPTNPVTHVGFEVTVVPAQWFTSVSWEKEFN